MASARLNVFSCLVAFMASIAHARGDEGGLACGPPVNLQLMKEIGDAVRAMYPFDADPKSTQALQAADRIMVVDRQNTAQLRPWLKRCGWPSTKRHGTVVEGLVWALVQHADQDRPFQTMAITLLRQRVHQGEAPGAHLAYLEDRIAVGSGQPQLYGTQAELKGPCLVELLPVENRSSVNNRRKAIGMASIESYMAELRKALLPPSCLGDSQP